MIPHSRPWITDEDHRAVAACLAEGLVAQGRRVARFEAAVAEALEGAGAVAVGSGTAALELAFRTLGVGPRNEVVLPTYVCRNVLEAVMAVGAVPVLADVGAHRALTPETVARHIGPRTGAVVLVHPFGLAIDPAPLQALGVPVVEDACQAFGARVLGRPVGPLGTVGVLSFHGTKCLTTGEGGAIVASDPELVERARRLREGAVNHRRVAAPMSDLQAALGESQVARYPEFLARRRAIAANYLRELADLPVKRPPDAGDGTVWFRFPLEVDGDVEALQARFAAEGVAVRRGVDDLLHHQLGLDPAGFPVAERAFARTLCLPLYPALDEAAQWSVLRACRMIWGS